MKEEIEFPRSPRKKARLASSPLRLNVQRLMREAINSAALGVAACDPTGRGEHCNALPTLSLLILARLSSLLANRFLPDSGLSGRLSSMDPDDLTSGDPDPYVMVAIHAAANAAFDVNTVNPDAQVRSSYLLLSSRSD